MVKAAKKEAELKAAQLALASGQAPAAKTRIPEQGKLYPYIILHYVHYLPTCTMTYVIHAFSIEHY